MNKILLAFSFFTFLNLPAQAGLPELVTQKTSNYNDLSIHYKLLLNSIERRNNSEFCSLVKDSYDNLVKIFYEDFELIDELREPRDEDFFAYAAELEENAYSPLFTYTAYLSACSEPDFNAASYTFSAKNNITNINYLGLLHKQWREAYGF